MIDCDSKGSRRRLLQFTNNHPLPKSNRVLIEEWRRGSSLLCLCDYDLIKQTMKNQRQGENDSSSSPSVAFSTTTFNPLVMTSSELVPQTHLDYRRTVVTLSPVLNGSSLQSLRPRRLSQTSSKTEASGGN